jgi:hypothetical protein
MSFPAPSSRTGFGRDKPPYRTYIIAGKRPDEKAAATKERYARRGDAGQGDEDPRSRRLRRLRRLYHRDPK